MRDLGSTFATWGVAGALALCAARGHCAEAGDIDGDGRITFGDVLALVDGSPGAPGALDGLAEHICLHEPAVWTADFHGRGILYHEAVRRSVPDSFPHWDGIWPDAVHTAPLDVDPAAFITIEPADAPGGADDHVRLALLLVAFVPIRGFFLILESPSFPLEGTVHPLEARDPNDSLDDLWTQPFYALRFLHAGGTIAVHADLGAFMVGGGRLVLEYGVQRADATLDPGDYRIEVDVRLPRGAAAGVHEVRLHPGSQVVHGDDGQVLQPDVDGPGKLTLRDAVRGGFPGGLPPLDLDRVERKIRGEVALRLADENGQPPPAGKAIAEAWPGQEVELRIQFRTEVPLNSVEAHVAWGGGTLNCSAENAIAVDPDTGLRYTALAGCSESFLGVSGTYDAVWTFGIRGYSREPEKVNTPEWPLAYFRPLDEWVDLAVFRVIVPFTARGGEDIPLRFVRRDSMAAPEWKPGFSPYAPEHLCDRSRFDLDVNWKIDPIVYGDAVIHVLGGTDPDERPPIDAGVRVLLGDASGKPGDTVTIPIFAAATEEISILRFAYAFEAQRIDVEAIEVDTVSAMTGETFTVRTPRGKSAIAHDPACDALQPGERCRQPSVFGLLSYKTTDDRLVTDVLRGDTNVFLPQTPAEIGRFIVKIREDAAGGRARIEPQEVAYDDGVFLVNAETGGILQQVGLNQFAPATELRAAEVFIEGAEPTFRRGDSNGDGRADLADAVFTLASLFLGGPAPRCEDAADADDDGVLAISDPIFLLGGLFLGGALPPPPGGACGADPTGDALACGESSCG